MTNNKKDLSDKGVSKSIDNKIRIALYDIEIMVENLKVKSTEHGQGDIIQRIYDIHSLLSEQSF